MSSKYRILMFLSDFTSCGYYRMVLPHLFLQSKLADEGIELTLSNKLEESNHYDCYMFGRVPGPADFMFAIKMFERDAKIIWDVDDDFISIPDWSPVKDQFGTISLHYLDQSFKMASAVTVSTSNLAAAVIDGFPAAAPASKVHVLENLIDTRTYFPARQGLQNRHLKVIWSGSSSHVGDVEPVEKIIDYIQSINGVIMVIYGYIKDEWKNKKNLVHISWGSKRNYEGILSLISPDVALLPLVDCPFNRCKSAIKYFEMTMAGAACIASDIPPFSDVITEEISHGFLAQVGDDHDKWIPIFENIVKNNLPNPRLINEKARSHVVDSFSWNTDNERRRAWFEFFKSIPDIPSA